jgi:hypothetical protein
METQERQASRRMACTLSSRQATPFFVEILSVNDGSFRHGHQRDMPIREQRTS